MRALAVVLVLMTPLAAFGEDGVVKVTQSGVFLKKGEALTRLQGDLAAELKLLAGEPVELEGRKNNKGAFVVTSIVSPERTEVNAVGRTQNGTQILLTDRGEALTPVGQTQLISSTKQRTYDVWRFRKTTDGVERVSVVAYEADTTKSWVILYSKAEISVPTGYIRGRRSVWVEEETANYVRVRRGAKRGWIPTSASAAIEVEPKGGLKKALEGAGGY